MLGMFWSLHDHLSKQGASPIMLNLDLKAVQHTSITKHHCLTTDWLWCDMLDETEGNSSEVSSCHRKLHRAGAALSHYTAPYATSS